MSHTGLTPLFTGKTVQSISLILTNPPPPSGQRVTLVVAPLSLMSQWHDEIKAKTAPGSLKVLVHHGPKRAKDLKKFSGVDVILTSYSTLQQECPASKKKSRKDADETDLLAPSKAAGPLLQMRYHRVILDEAHNIKNKDTATAKACFELSAEYRWCLTGTPIQNSVEDLYSLLKFLKFKPHDDHTFFKTHITMWLNRGKGITAIKRLQVIMKAILLRRTKASVDLKLPPKTINHVLCDFSEVERKLYNEHEATAKAKVSELVDQAGDDGKVNTISALNILLRLRQICNHAKLIGATDLDSVEGENGGDETDEMEELAAQLGSMSVTSKCSYCLDPLGHGEVGRCRRCITVLGEETSSRTGALDSPRNSAKANMTIEILNRIRQDRPHAKTIVFSQFVKMIDLLEAPLEANGIEFLRYEGKMNEKARAEVLQKFRTMGRYRVLLASLKCASLGLNLTVATNVILFDPWWNPAVENQAMDRVHRLGQTSPVSVYKITVRDTVEDRILELQARKAALADGALGEGVFNNRNKSKLTLEEIAYIFSGEDEGGTSGKAKRRM
ncbi:hypothetical protein M427DRAFT_96122 [Gonapodya prolifera JEL478]|uniref:P-loop containing nucleoside triphosphate hydrolase protein n=1 Tax=Gonapodya prolifera (strain JEL478) TaxID=1344416 RepID=A0A139ANY0_GONPJ|nr:hypothetical protein M427DRAFT_96122 [Gonapodya prolifera JEL478]|eukprot:KXS18467.1 hypothetical protein M427DRAFT_96122 [Gonapodya prolifera JEL478]